MTFSQNFSKQDLPLISILIPFRNEASHIARCISSLLDSGYPKSQLEFILIDGNSDDDSINIINNIDIGPAQLQICHNPQQIVPTAMNIGTQAASADILLWAGAHSIYHKDYITHSVQLLIDNNAASVGGVIEPVGISPTGQAIALAASNPFGVGNAKYRYAKKAGWVDTVFAGCFYKKDILSIGGFNEAWTINQDSELNYRLRTQIGGIYLSPLIRSQYFVRETYSKLASQYYRYGKGRAKTLLLHPKSLSPRQIAAPLFLILLTLSGLFSLVSVVPFMLLLLVHSAAGFFFIEKHRKSTITFKQKARTYMAFFTMHMTWGAGFITHISKHLIKTAINKAKKTSSTHEND